MASPNIDAIVRSWRLSGECELGAGATQEQLRSAEQLIGRTFPSELFDLYSQCDGAHVLRGNLQLDPLDGRDSSVVRSSPWLRSVGWPVPDELIVFAGNGGGDSFGIWLPRVGHHAPLVIEVGAIFEEGSFAVVGTSLGAFLRGRTAYYLLLLECPAESLDELDVPQSLRVPAEELGDEEYDALARWSDPGLPDSPLSPYDARLTAGDIRNIASRSG